MHTGILGLHFKDLYQFLDAAFIQLRSIHHTRRCYDRPTLDRFARHYQTDELLPDDLFQKLVAARTFRRAPMPVPQL